MNTSTTWTSRTLNIGGRVFEWGARTYVMGVVNVTPDSFSGDGIGADARAAADLARRFEDEGADIIDVGGESTRPPSVYQGAEAVSEADELTRVLPAIESIAAAVSVPVSIDTRKAAVARKAVSAGASLVNDVTMLEGDSAIAATVAECRVPVVISHNRAKPKYDDVVGEVVSDLMVAVFRAEKAGIAREKVILDPGIGFGKTVEHSLEVLRELREITQLGFPVLVGPSRKSSIGAVLDLPVDDRLEGTAATVALAIERGADIVRVHDVKQMARVAKMSDAIVRGWSPSE